MVQYREREIEIGWGTGAKIAAGVIGFFVLLTMWLGAFRVDQYERGIITRNGAFQRIAEPGLGFMIPWVDSIHTIDMRELNPKYPDMEMYSADRQLAKVDASIVISPKPHKLKELYSEYRTVEYAISKIIAPLMPSEIKVVFGRYTAERLIRERDKLNIETKDRIIAALGENSIFNVRFVPVEDIEFSKDYVKSIEERMKAEVEVDKTRQHWENEKIKADIIKTQADAMAYQVEVKGKAEALAIDLMGQALAKNPKYVDKLTAERWDGKLPQTMVPGSAVPFMNLNAKN